MILYLPVDGHKNILFRTADKVADKTLLNILVIYKKKFVCVQKKGKYCNVEYIAAANDL